MCHNDFIDRMKLILGVRFRKQCSIKIPVLAHDSDRVVRRSVSFKCLCFDDKHHTCGVCAARTYSFERTIHIIHLTFNPPCAGFSMPFLGGFPCFSWAFVLHLSCEVKIKYKNPLFLGYSPGKAGFCARFPGAFLVYLENFRIARIFLKFFRYLSYCTIIRGDLCLISID